MNPTINPSILSANFCNIEKDIKILEKNSITSIHIDVMDGNFVPNIAFGIDQIRAIREITEMKFDIHLMINDPDKFIERFVDAGADNITVHAEACPHLYRTIELIKKYGVSVGIALNPATSIESLRYLYKLIDKVLIMTVEPGFGGQNFIEEMKNKLKDLVTIKEKYNYNFSIQVDGGINKDNVEEIVKLGVTDVVIGSSIFKNNEIEKNLKEIYSALKMEG
ncbi:ribulose-phosphate 3-epimerase [Thermoanaerobacterium thermosaccharolyticum]|uniref:ribulose-phosphate 3-epimerase n=1 Tax=Thermoanaerobacterium thermosaccharolyticum TaxID=1517 RepID=UPI003DA89D29